MQLCCLCPECSLGVLNPDRLLPLPTEPASVLLGNRVSPAVIPRKWNLEPRFLVLALPPGKSLFLSLGLFYSGDCGLSQVQVPGG